nr:uncharacterized protein LOC123772392 isoform X2 [Procambarus clarkii]
MHVHDASKWVVSSVAGSDWGVSAQHGEPCWVMALVNADRHTLKSSDQTRDAGPILRCEEGISEHPLPVPHAHTRLFRRLLAPTPEMMGSRGREQSHLVVVVGTLSCLLLHTVSQPLPGIQKTAGDTETEDPVGDIRHVLPEVNLENNTVIDVNVNIGDVAHLPCRFPQLSTLHQKAFLLLQVSWIRRWDWHILTTGIYTYTSDERFNVLHLDGSDDWTLQIKYAEIRDNGTYECQMYTGTGVLSQFVNLHVHTPRAAILGPQELHVQEGDTITLICVIQQSKPPFVFWYHGEKMVNYDSGSHRLSVITKVEGTRTHSRLTIIDARSWDSGNYSCVPPNVEPAFVLVYVTEAGDTVAAVQRRGHTAETQETSSAVRMVFQAFFISCITLLTHFLPVR